MSTRNLTFQYAGDGRVGNGGDDIILKLYVVPSTTSPTPTSDPWRTTIMSTKGTGKPFVDVTWNGIHVFSTPSGPVSGKGFISAVTAAPIKIGQKTTLAIERQSDTDLFLYRFTEPVKGDDPACAEAVNGTGHPVEISLGYVTDFDTPEEVLHLNSTDPDVGDTMLVSGNHQPILRAVVILKHQDSPGLRVRCSVPIWEGDLLDLRPKTTIRISKNAQGAFIGTEQSDCVTIPLPSADTTLSNGVVKQDSSNKVTEDNQPATVPKGTPLTRKKARATQAVPEGTGEGHSGEPPQDSPLGNANGPTTINGLA